MEKIKVKITFAEGILGTSPSDKDIYRNYIGSKAPDAETVEEEVERLGEDAVVERGTTVFPRLEDGTPFLYDYQIKGFFKDTCKALRKVKDTKSEKVKNYKQVIDKLIFPQPRTIPIFAAGPITELQRPLRAQTPQGERVSLAISEEIPAGSWMEFTVLCLSKEHIGLVKEWLDYGILSGIGQWRNSGKGRFTWELVKEN